MSLLNQDIQDFISANLTTSVAKLALQKNPFPEIDFKLILNQIEAKSKAKDKLPTWFKTKNILYPSKISIEQTSSEIAANYKSELVSGTSLIDLTGGFGIDDYYFSKKVKQVTHCEINPDLSALVRHNFTQLHVTNITCIPGDSAQILEDLGQHFDTIYIDPSRRNDLKGKVFMLKDCLPNVPELQEFYFKFTNKILIKTAPILDLAAGLSELQNVATIYIVAVDNEVKELLWELEKNYNGNPQIRTVNFNKDQCEEFNFNYIHNQQATLSLPKKYLYEPNSAIMKSGGFAPIGNLYGLEKLHQHSHLYTSNKNVKFPGRVFLIQNCVPYSKNEMKQYLENQKSNVTTRNFPESVEHIRKKWKIKDGGTTYSFFTTDKNDNKIALICTKL